MMNSCLVLLALLSVSLAMMLPPYYNRHFEGRHHHIEPEYPRFGHHNRFRRQYFGGMGMGGRGGFGGGGWGGMGGGMNNLGMMAAQMGGQFPGVVQSNSNSWGSFKSERQGGFNNQEQSLIMG